MGENTFGWSELISLAAVIISFATILLSMKSRSEKETKNDQQVLDKLDSLESMSEREIEWIQYHLIECEYQLPTFPDKDGNAPIGNAAKGISGRVSKELTEAIKSYMNEYQVPEESFVSHIECLVQKGIVSHAV